MRDIVVFVLLLVVAVAGVLLMIDAATGDRLFIDWFLKRQVPTNSGWATSWRHKMRVGLLGLIMFLVYGGALVFFDLYTNLFLPLGGMR